MKKQLIKIITSALVIVMATSPKLAFANNTLSNSVYVYNIYVQEKLQLQPRIILTKTTLTLAAAHMIGANPKLVQGVANTFETVVNGVKRTVTFTQGTDGLWQAITNGGNTVSNFFFRITG